MKHCKNNKNCFTNKLEWIKRYTLPLDHVTWSNTSYLNIVLIKTKALNKQTSLVDWFIFIGWLNLRCLWLTNIILQLYLKLSNYYYLYKCLPNGSRKIHFSTDFIGSLSASFSLNELFSSHLTTLFRSSCALASD